MEHSRRKFLKHLGGGAAALSLGAKSTGASNTIQQQLIPTTRVRSVDKIRIGLIGSGIIGHYDTDTALKVDGMELGAVCDLYTGRLDRAKEKWGANYLQPGITGNYWLIKILMRYSFVPPITGTSALPLTR